MQDRMKELFKIKRDFEGLATQLDPLLRDSNINKLLQSQIRVQDLARKVDQIET